MNKRALFRLLTILVVPFIAIVVLETSLYLFGFGTTYEQEDPFLGFQTIYPLFERKETLGVPEDTLYVTRKSKLTWFNHQEFKANKPQNGYRIFCFGGSTTFGRPYDYKTSFSNWLEAVLQY